jgi:predicted RNase H-like HicB family nuclease
MKFRLLIEYDAEAESYSAVCPELPGCASAGSTEEEARQNIREAIRLYPEPDDIPIPPNAKLIEVMIG